MEGLPRVAAYLEALPNGLASYPEYTQKAALYRQFLKHAGALRVANQLPPELRLLVEQPVPVNTWLPEVMVNALYLGVADALHLDDEGVNSLLADLNRAGQLPGVTVSVDSAVGGIHFRVADAHGEFPIIHHGL